MDIRRNLDEYVGSLNVSSAKKKLSYAILEGAYLHREKKGKGTRTIQFQDGKKQRVDTYDGRIKAVVKILGADYEGLNKIYSNVLESNQKYFSKNTKAKEKLESYVSNYKSESVKKGKLEAKLSRPISSTRSSKNNSFSGLTKNIRRIAAIAAVSAATIFGAYYLGPHVSISSKPVEIRMSEKMISSSPTKKIYVEDSLKQEIKADLKKIEEKKNSLDIDMKKAEECLRSYKELVKEREENDKKFDKNLKEYEDSVHLLINTLREYNIQEVLKKRPVVSKEEQSFSVSDDLGGYLCQVNSRNAQIVNGEVSFNPKNLVDKLVDNFMPIAEEITTKDLGYGYQKLTKRKIDATNGLEKSWNGFKKLVSFGFWDSSSEEEKGIEGNQALRFLKSPYDIVIGAVDSTINSADFVTGGISKKTLDVAGKTIDFSVGSVVDVSNYILTPIGIVDEEAYEFSSVPTRFAGNVLTHEVAKNGKEYKGEIGATLELSTGLALDTLGILGVSGSFNSSGSSTNIISNNNGGGWNGNPVGN